MKEIIRPFDLDEQYVKMHNALFDVVMASMSPNTWKVFCFIIRKTIGWKKSSDLVSYSQIMKGCGIKGRSTISAALTELGEMNAIKSDAGNGRTATRYAVNVQFSIETSPEIGPVAVQKLDHLAVQKLDTQKKALKDKERKKSTGASAPPAPNVHQVIFSAIADACLLDVSAKSNAARVGRCAAWLAKKDGIKPEHVGMFGAWFASNDWRGQKGERPTPEQMMSEWAKFAAGYKPKPQRGPRTRAQAMYTPEMRAAKEREAALALAGGEE